MHRLERVRQQWWSPIRPSITVGTQNPTCFKSSQSGAFECRGGTKIFGKSVNPCPSLYSHTTEYIFITFLYSEILRFSAQIKHFFPEIWFSRIWRSNSGNAEHSSRLDCYNLQMVTDVSNVSSASFLRVKQSKNSHRNAWRQWPFTNQRSLTDQSTSTLATPITEHKITQKTAIRILTTIKPQIQPSHHYVD